MVVGGLNPLGEPGGAPRSEAAGIVNVFPVPTPWKPNRRISPTVKFCELWIKDRDRGGDYATIQLIYPDIIVEGDLTGAICPRCRGDPRSSKFSRRSRQDISGDGHTSPMF